MTSILPDRFQQNLTNIHTTRSSNNKDRERERERAVRVDCAQAVNQCLQQIQSFE
jgi:1,6-anhydro-N-acetylmuramate kinase